jgi:hypothetical protein
MRIFVSCLLALLVAAGVTSARAADFKSFKDAPSVSRINADVGNPFAGLYGGVTAGAQFTDITITDSHGGDEFSGLSADGGLVGGHIGFNFCPGRVCIGPAAEFAFSNVSLEAGPLGDILRMDDYIQLTMQAGVVIGRQSYISVHAGYEWQSWVLDLDRIGGGEHDADVEAWVIGGSIATMVTENLAVSLVVDYLLLSDIADAPGGLVSALEESDALRVKLRGTWHLGNKVPDLF